MTFTAIDFETAHAKFPCEIGLCRVENGEITETLSQLIKPACFPYMNPFCQRVHGITPAELKDEPDFEELWGTLHPWLEDTILVAHNAAFDMSVLRASLCRYDLAVPHSDYFCSISLARRTWKGLPSYSLGNLCAIHNIHFNHHRAGADAEACAKLVLKASLELSVHSLETLLNRTGIKSKAL
jgi:DNA polymerase III subunit epsilon